MIYILYLFSKGSFSIGHMWISSGCYFMRFMWSQSLIGGITAHASEILEKYSQFNDFCQINYAKKVSTYPNWQNHSRVSICWMSKKLGIIKKRNHRFETPYSRVRNKHSPTIINFWLFSRGYGLIPDYIEAILVVQV